MAMPLNLKFQPNNGNYNECGHWAITVSLRSSQQTMFKLQTIFNHKFTTTKQKYQISI